MSHIKSSAPYLYMKDKAHEAIDFYASCGFKVLMKFIYDEQQAKHMEAKVGDVAWALLSLDDKVLITVGSSNFGPEGSVVLEYEKGQQSLDAMLAMAKKLAAGGKYMHNDKPNPDMHHICFDDKYGISWVLGIL